MAQPPRRRGPSDPRSMAEAAFKSATTAPPLPAAKAPPLPGVREQISLRVDRAVLDFFQKDGAGWQERMHEVLRQAAGVPDGSIPIDRLNASNDE